MTYPDSFEQKIGFTEIRTLLKGRCLSSLGTEWVDNKVCFMNSYADVVKALAQAQEFAALLDAEPEVCEENFYDVRPSLLRIRPERTYMEEVELFELGRTLSSVCSLVNFLTAPSENEEGDDAAPYPALSRMAGGVSAFPTIVRSINDTLNRYGKVKDTASPELLSLRHQLEVTSRGISHTLRTIVTQAQSDGYIDRDVSPTLRDGRLVIPVA
ncbi:MAG: endonuclease MutS2, partial [Bacteroidaceae bacterium]|nr:endonuclease MutS2 [Bacteroidaceae bacterium]